MKYIISWTEQIRYNAIFDWPDDIETQTRLRLDELRANALPEYSSVDSFKVQPYIEDRCDLIDVEVSK
jgi:hypothetical protein